MPSTVRGSREPTHTPASSLVPRTLPGTLGEEGSGAGERGGWSPSPARCCPPSCPRRVGEPLAFARGYRRVRRGAGRAATLSQRRQRPPSPPRSSHRAEAEGPAPPAAASRPAGAPSAAPSATSPNRSPLLRARGGRGPAAVARRPLPHPRRRAPAVAVATG